MTSTELNHMLSNFPDGELAGGITTPLMDGGDHLYTLITPIMQTLPVDLPAKSLSDEDRTAEFTPIFERGAECGLSQPVDFTYDYEVPTDILARLPGATESTLHIPDISVGLGRRQERHEMKELERFATEQMQLRVYSGDLCEFRPPCWRRLDSRTCTIRLKEIFRPHGLDTHLGTSDYQELYRALCTNPALQGGEVPEPPLHRLNLQDATYDIQQDRFYPHDPEDGFFSALKLTSGDLMDPGEGQIFENFLSSVSGGDPEVRQQVLELVALACTGYPIKAFFVLVGPSGTGKSQLGRFLVELLGHENAAAIGGVHELGSRFALAGMEDIQLAACMDLPDATLPAAAIGTLKTAVSDDAKKLEAKYRNPRTIYHGPLWLFASNHPLRLPNIEQEEAFLSRMVLVPFSHAAPPDQQIPQLYRRLLEEAPYIVAQSIPAYRRLMQNNFTPTRAAVPPEYSPGEGIASLAAVEQFLQKFCTSDPESSVSTEKLFQAYSQAVADAHWPMLNKIAFSRTIASLLITWDGVSGTKRAGGDELRGYHGLRLIEPLKGGDLRGAH